MNIKIKLWNLLTTILIFIFSFSVAMADGMKIKPGLWKTKSIVTMPFNQGTQEHEAENCIDEDSVSPHTLMQDAEGCEITDAVSTENSMQWKITCNNAGVVMNGEGNASTTGDTLSGGMQIKASFNDQDMTMSTKWEGKNIGACK